MDRLYQIRRKSREMTTYSVGHCHICKQSSVKVRRLNCGKHNYCRMCVEFVPRLIKGDFGCKTCSSYRRFDVPSRKDDVGAFLSTKTGSSNDNFTFTTVENTDFDEPNDDNDLEGNNEEWDHLLQSFDDQEENRQPGENKSWISNTNSTNAPVPNTGTGFIPRKRSYVQLIPPSTLFNGMDANEEDNQYNRHDKAGHIAQNTIRIVEPSRDRTSHRAHERPMPPHINKFLCRGRFKPDPLELERGTSPCKGNRRNVSLKTNSEFGDLGDYIEPSLSETEQLKEQIGDIEGPAFTSSSASESNESLLFSASNISANVQEFEEFWDRK